MDLRENPFFVLGATPRDDRRRLLALADDKSLTAGPDAEHAIAEARATLTNPGKRIAAEVAWLPGLAPERAAQLLDLLREKPWRVPFERSLPQLAKLNLLAAALREAKRFLRVLLPEHVADLIAALCQAHARIRPELVLSDINADRQVAGFGAVDDVSRLVPLLDERRRHAERAINRALRVLAEAARRDALTRAVAVATDDGGRHGPQLLEDIVDGYETAARGALDDAAANVGGLVEQVRARAAVDAGHFMLDGLIEQLEQAVRAWDAIAQPIQLCARSRGIEHEPSHELAGQVRDLAIALHNEHDRTDLSQRLTELLGVAFAEVDAVAEQVADDAAALSRVAAQEQAMTELEPLRNRVRAMLGQLARAQAGATRDDVSAQAQQAQVLKGLDRFEQVRQRLAADLDDPHALDGLREAFAVDVRQRVVDLVNEHGCVDLGLALTQRLRTLFGDLDDLGDRLHEDLEALAGLARSRAEQAQRKDQWRREIAYETRLGLLRTRLRISADSIEWQGREWALDEIERVRWGGVRKSVNGIPTGTKYSIAFGARRVGAGLIELTQDQVFEAVVERLWKTVGVRLLTEMLVGLRDGGSYDFDTTVIDDRGCTLIRSRLLRADERLRLDWPDVRIGSASGALVIAAKFDERFATGLSYMYQDNVHVLEAALNMMLARRATRLSSLLVE